ncbi:MAG TPA: acyl-CoA reductase, partial [Daejeonella sp.]|nr:acyl-CoA reductase [Daejeonella sp.]
HLDNGFLLLKEDLRFVSPLVVLYYEEYQSLEKVGSELLKNKDLIQCIVSNSKLPLNTVAFGQSQCPGLFDYADGVDTMKFLRELR